jgi:phosphoribosylformylglycinamidine cyclo-ligase
LPNGVYAELETDSVSGNGWTLPAVFQWLQLQANLTQLELIRTFNCGIGMVVIVSENNYDDVMRQLKISEEITSPPIRLGCLKSCALDSSTKVSVIGKLI